jgi:hypothetical protein
MKTVLAALCLVVMGCANTREINVEMVSAQLIRIDTIYRNTEQQKQQLIWRDRDNIEYVTLVSMNRSFPVGVVMTVLRQR